MKRVKKSLAVLLIVLPLNIVSGQGNATDTVAGIVTSFKTFPLKNVTVKSVRTGLSTVTDSLGKFNIGKTDDDVLQITAKGFLSQRIKAKNVQKLFINLKYAYKESSIKDAVENGHITEKMLNEALRMYPQKGMRDYSTYHDIFSLIRAEFPTLRVQDNTVYNRQSYSLSNQVLYVVNGMMVNDISTITPGEIKKLEFLQDNAAAEYGISGANGVLRVTLK